MAISQEQMLIFQSHRKCNKNTLKMIKAKMSWKCQVDNYLFLRIFSFLLTPFSLLFVFWQFWHNFYQTCIFLSQSDIILFQLCNSLNITKSRSMAMDYLIVFYHFCLNIRSRTCCQVLNKNLFLEMFLILINQMKILHSIDKIWACL